MTSFVNVSFLGLDRMIYSFDLANDVFEKSIYFFVQEVPGPSILFGMFFVLSRQKSKKVFF